MNVQEELLQPPDDPTNVDWRPTGNGGCFKFNRRNKADGITLMKAIPAGAIATAFFDPQYRNGKEAMGYGDEGRNREVRRSMLTQMDNSTITAFIDHIARCLRNSGHLFLWMDKFELLNDFRTWIHPCLNVVDMITWDKKHIGMGYRSRRRSEYLVVIQKSPKRAKGCWTDHTIPDVWQEDKPAGDDHPHRKPIFLQERLIRATTDEGDVVMDPAAGSFSVLKATSICERNFIGGDVNG